MASMVRITSRWDGFPGSPGYTNLLTRPNGGGVAAAAQTFADDIHDFWNTVNGYLPAAVTVTIVPTYQVVDDVTGNVTSEGTVATPPAAVTGNSGAIYAGNAGAAINWSTDTFIDGSRLTGRTYLVPFTGCFETNGTLSAAAIAAIAAAGQALVDANQGLLVWHRPVGGTGGSSSDAVSATVRDRAAILRSRSI